MNGKFGELLRNTHMAQRNYVRIKQDIRDIIDSEMDRIMSDPSLAKLVVQKNLPKGGRNAGLMFFWPASNFR